MATLAGDRRLVDVKHKLFPHNPIEVSKEKEGDRVYFHIYMEGQWHSKIEGEDEVVDQIHWLCETYGDDWYYPSTRVNPNWEGWSKISKVDLAGFCI